jgi:prevent-host-death family protein
MKVSTTEIQNAFGKYLNLAMEQEDVIITKNGKNVAKLISYDQGDKYIIKEAAEDYVIKQKVTYEEFLEIVENSEQRYELIDGELYLLASPLFKHQVAANEVFVNFYNWFKGKKCRPLTSPFDVKLYNKAKKFEDDPNVVQPDVLVMCDEENVAESGKYEGIPTLVVEVLSKSSRSKDMLKKLNLYMNSGVLEYWLIDTQHKQVLVYSFKDRSIYDSTFYMADMCVESEAFKGLKVNLNDIFTW